MDARSILEALLTRGKNYAAQGKNIAEEKLNIPSKGSERDAMLSGLGKGALAAGALGLLFGTKAGRRVGSTGLKLGSLAAIGGIGYQAYKKWQNSSTDSVKASLVEGETAESLHGEEADKRAEALLKAMIAAAKVDGHIDQDEQNRISEHIETLGLEASAAEFLHSEMSGPIDPASIAALADSQEAAIELYLASLYVMGTQSHAEREYLDQLAAGLHLSPALMANLEQEMNNQG